MELINVISARKTTGDLLDLVIVLDNGQGEETLPYGYRKGDTFGIGPQVDQWFKDHKSFPIGNAEPSTPAPARISKNAIWERATDAEAEQMEAALATQPVRIRRIYEGATHINTDHELFTLLNGALTGLFGATRAAQLLAPTD